MALAATPHHKRAWLLLVCLVAAVGPGVATYENGRRWGRRHRPSGARVMACFVTHHRGGLSSRAKLERRDGLVQYSTIDRRRWRVAALRHSVGDENEGPDATTDDTSSLEPSADEPNNDVDPDGTPLFDTYERATLFGLEPKAEVDPLDNGLQFTGPIILLASIYVTLALFFADEVPPLDL